MDGGTWRYSPWDHKELDKTETTQHAHPQGCFRAITARWKDETDEGSGAKRCLTKTPEAGWGGCTKQEIQELPVSDMQKDSTFHMREN